MKGLGRRPWSSCRKAFVLASMDGIDVIAERIAELRATVKAHPSLTSISLVGYSMGGLIARYLAGSLFVEKPVHSSA